MVTAMKAAKCRGNLSQMLAISPAASHRDVRSSDGWSDNFHPNRRTLRQPEIPVSGNFPSPII
jgi:hypothetical protein